MNLIQLNHTELQIIQCFFDNQTEFVSSKEIATVAEVSDKTVRKYIQSLKTLLETYGGRIEMKKGSGYRLMIEDNQSFYKLMEHVRDHRVNVADSSLLGDNSERERFILNAVLLENQRLTIDDLADLMFISRSTVSTVIQLIKSRIKKYRLAVTYDQDGYVVIEGDEIEKRRFILKYFYTTQSVDYVNSELFDYEFEGFSMETIFIIVLETCREFDIQLSDYVLQNLVMHIALAIKRNEKGFSIEAVDINEVDEYSKELFVAHKIVTKIEALLAIKFPLDEAKYIALHLKSKSNSLMTRQNKGKGSLHQQLMEALEELQAKYSIAFSLDQQLLMGLSVHIKPLITRLESGITLDNPLYGEVSTKYADILQACKEVFAKMPCLLSYQVSDHEWAYVVLHVLAAIERYKQENKVNAIVICATGLGSAQMLKSRLENEFSSNLNIVDVISYYQLSDDLLENIDLIISTIDISTSFYNVPAVKVSVFLNKQDIDSLNRYIQGGGQNLQALGKNKYDDKIEQVFHRYFNEERFVVFEQEIQRDNALDILIRRLSDSDKQDFQQDLKNQIQIREQFGSLAFSDQVAFPHPAQPVGLNSEIVVGVCLSQLEWDSDHTEVQIIILMSHSRIENKGLDIINSGLAEFINHQDKVAELLKQPSFEQFKALFMEIIAE